MPNMIAMAVPQPGGKLERVERAVPAPGPGELLIEIRACGVCHSDRMMSGKARLRVVLKMR